MKRFIQLVTIFFCLNLSLLVLDSANTIAETDNQTQLSASMFVSESNVEVKRADTPNWVPVSTETIVSVNDEIRTDASGSAEIDFIFVDVQVDIMPSTEVEIAAFSQSENGDLTLILEVKSGFIAQTSGQNDTVTTPATILMPGLQITTTESNLTTRVEEDGRSSILVFEGSVTATGDLLDGDADVSDGFGVRSPIGDTLSEVVTAETFPELDAKLDGCAGVAIPQGDFSFNVRLGPNVDAPRVGTVSAGNIDRYFGQSEDELWYRIPFGGYFGWFSAQYAEVTVEDACGGLRTFEASYQENIDRFNLVGTTNSATVLVDLANIRIGPGTSYRIIDTANNGTFLIVNGRTQDNEWLQIYQGDGKLGWISAELVRLYVNFEDVAIIPVDTLNIDDQVETESENNENTNTDDN